jgi:hypothetical protein
MRGTIVSARLRVRAALGQAPTNWYRLHDGSDKESSRKVEPLMFTAGAVLKRGEVVTISGKLALDKDFGGGLSYKMIVEEATVTREVELADPAGPEDTKPPSVLPKKVDVRMGG